MLSKIENRLLSRPQRGKPIHGLPVRAWHQVPIDIHCCFDAGVPQLVSHVGEALSVLDQQRSKVWRMS